ncbi:UNVERIFIED_CONTAM: hypothetical protein HHA_449490 [Hammondia hammondi]|eukprot:XP_008882160.1 hypothetical protein HHA_449490 [Hammondia hammondi]
MPHAAAPSASLPFEANGASPLKSRRIPLDAQSGVNTCAGNGLPPERRPPATADAIQHAACPALPPTGPSCARFQSPQYGRGREGKPSAAAQHVNLGYVCLSSPGRARSGEQRVTATHLVRLGPSVLRTSRCRELSFSRI